MIVINVNGVLVNHWQLTDSADGTPQTKTELQRIADGWPPPDGTAVLDADKSTSTPDDIGKANGL